MNIEKFEIEITCKKCGSKNVAIEFGGYMGDAIMTLHCNECHNHEDELS